MQRRKQLNPHLRLSLNLKNMGDGRIALEAPLSKTRAGTKVASPTNRTSKHVIHERSASCIPSSQPGDRHLENSDLEGVKPGLEDSRE